MIWVQFPEAVIVIVSGAIADSALVASTVGGVFIIINSIITIWLTQYMDRRRYEDQPPDDSENRNTSEYYGNRRGDSPSSKSE